MNLQIQVLRQINTNVEYATQATENSFRNKVFVVVDGERISSFNKTKRGAESAIKKNSFSYYDEYSHEMVNAGSSCKIVEICALDIADYYNDVNVWFETLFARWKISQSNQYMLTKATEMGCSENVINLIKSVLEESDANSFPSREMVGLEENEQTESIEEVETIEHVEAVAETTETIETTPEITDNVTMKLNEEKNGVELYFFSIPSEDVRNSLKSNGFKWSRYNKCWYAKQSDDTLSLAEQLASGNVETVATAEQSEIELIEFVDITQFTISEETEKRLIDNSLFGDRRSVGLETKKLHQTLHDVLEMTKSVIELTTSTYNKNKLINGFNSFCERYTKELGSYLYQNSINPSWAVTGRGGLNVNRYNKKQDQLNNKMLKVVEMLDKQKSILDKYKWQFKRETDQAIKQGVTNTINGLSSIVEFTTRKREIEYYGYKYNTRSYESNNYFFMNLSGCYRIFEKSTGKEVYSMKTADKLTDAKNYVTYLENERLQAVI